MHISVNESMNNRSTRRVKHTTALVKSTDRKLQNQQACYDGIQPEHTGTINCEKLLVRVNELLYLD